MSKLLFPFPATIAGLTQAVAAGGATFAKIGSIPILKSKWAYLRPNDNGRDIVMTVARVAQFN